VEEGRTVDVIRNPRHPYTSHLVTSLPRIGDVTQKRGLDGVPPNLASPPGAAASIRAARSRCRPAAPSLPDGRRRARTPRGLLGDRASQSTGDSAMSAALFVPLLEVDHVGMTYAVGGLFAAAESGPSTM